MDKEPAYKISANVNEGVLEITIKGRITDETEHQLTEDMFEIMTTSVEKALVDISDLKWHADYSEIYTRVRNYPPHFYRIKFAMVDVNGYSEHETFHETTALNAGMRLKWFKDLESARNWLKST